MISRIDTHFDSSVLVLFAAISVATGTTFAVVAEARLASLGFTVGAIAVAASVAGWHATFITKSGARRAPVISMTTIGSQLCLLAGFAWMIPALLDPLEIAETFNASLLLLAAGTLLVISRLRFARGRYPGESGSAWLLAVLTASASTAVAVVASSRVDSAWFETRSLDWFLACTMAILGATMLSVVAIYHLGLNASHGSLEGAWRGSLGWALAGTGFLFQSLAILQEPDITAAWWLPILPLGVLLVFSQDFVGIELTGHSRLGIARGARRGRALAGLSLTACIAAAMLVGLVQGSPKPEDWALVAAAAVVLTTSVLTVAIGLLMAHGQIADLARRVSLLSRLSRTDPLTGMANRREIDARLNEEIQRAARFGHSLSIGIVDVDDFKMVNDTYGHAAGDLVLQGISSVLARELRTIDIVGRYGGEEFLLVLPETSAAGAAIAATRIADAVSTEGLGDRRTIFPLSVSIGIAEFITNGRSAGEMLEAADRALYRAKQAGKNRVVVAATGQR